MHKEFLKLTEGSAWAEVEKGGAEVEKFSPTLLEAVSEKLEGKLDGGKDGKLDGGQTLDADMEPGEYEKESHDFPLAGSALTDKLDDKGLEKKKKSKSDPKNKTKKHKGKSPPRTSSSRKRTGSSSPDDHENEKRSYDTRAIDMDGDGDLDVLIAGHTSNNVVWFENPLK